MSITNFERNKIREAVIPIFRDNNGHMSVNLHRHFKAVHDFC